MPEVAGDAQARLLNTIRGRRAGIDSYVREKTPASTRLSTISIISSAVAAALTAGPALGGGNFAQTVQEGLELGGTEPVWRVLCFAALAVSVTAAISANLSRAHDLTSRIAAAEAAGAMLEKLQRRLEYGGLPVQEAVQEYGDIVAGIPFVPEVQLDRPSRDSGTARRTGPGARRSGPAWLLAAIVPLLGALLLIAVLVGYTTGLTRSSSDETVASPTPDATATPPVSPTSSPPSPTTPVQGPGVFAGRTEVGAASLAIVLNGDGTASAYLCDGAQIEAWLDGPVVGDQLDLIGGNGATLTGSITDGAISGQIATPSLSTAFEVGEAVAPAGVYEWRGLVNGVDTRVGWAVQSDGSQVGITNEGGVRTPAPPLNLGDLSFMLHGEKQFAARA